MTKYPYLVDRNRLLEQPEKKSTSYLFYNKLDVKLTITVPTNRPPLWSSGQSFWLQIQRSRVRSPALPDFLSSSGSGTGSTQPREVN